MVDWIFYKSYVAFVIIRLVIFYTCLFVKKKYHDKDQHILCSQSLLSLIPLCHRAPVLVMLAKNYNTQLF